MLQTAELLKKVRKLEIVTSRLVDDVIGGAYHSVFKGRGIEFDEVREYTVEDDVRDIDWNVSARLNAPYVKKYIEERELTVLLMLDVSNSVNSAVLSDKAVEAAALLGLSAIGNHDRVGLSLFSDRVEKFLNPRNGRHNNLRLIRELVAVSGSERTGSTDIAGALRNACSILVKRSVIFLITDLLDQSPELETAIQLASRRHDVIVLHLFDPDSWVLPDGVNTLYDAEKSAFIRLNSRRARQEYTRSCREITESRQNLCRRCGAEVIPLPGNAETVSALMKFFHQRRKHRRMRNAGSNKL